LQRELSRQRRVLGDEQGFVGGLGVGLGAWAALSGGGRRADDANKPIFIRLLTFTN